MAGSWYCPVYMWYFEAWATSCKFQLNIYNNVKYKLGIYIEVEVIGKNMQRLNIH